MHWTKQRFLALVLIGACLWLGACLGSYHVCEARSSGSGDVAGFFTLDGQLSSDPSACVACAWAKSVPGLTQSTLLPVLGTVVGILLPHGSDHISPDLSSFDSRAPPRA